jgi:hypothetical protein
MTRRRLVVFRSKKCKKGNTQEHGPPSRVLCRQLSLTDKERVQRTTALHQQSKTRCLPRPNLAIFRALFFQQAVFPRLNPLPIHSLIGSLSTLLLAPANAARLLTRPRTRHPQPSPSQCPERPLKTGSLSF